MFVKNKQRVSSPHTRRYFLSGLLGGGSTELFSAHAEVFPNPARYPTPTKALLRTRGGISLYITGTLWTTSSSPHTRRYFLISVNHYEPALLFSAHAEVFP